MIYINALLNLETSLQKKEEKITENLLTIERYAFENFMLKKENNTKEQEKNTLKQELSHQEDKIRNFNTLYLAKEEEVRNLNKLIKNAKDMVMPEFQNFQKEIDSRQETIRQLKIQIKDLERAKPTSSVDYEDLFNQKSSEFLHY